MSALPKFDAMFEPAPCLPTGADPATDVQDINALGDARFRLLLQPDQWRTLPKAVRRRFSKRVSDGVTVVYKGRVTRIAFSPLGYALAQVLRLAGAPLPVSRAIGLESAVTVTEDRATGGQFWTRLYVRDAGFPQVIHSVKRFAGPTGLEEAIGLGIVMSLRLSVEDGALVFRSAGYALCAGTWRLPLPRLFNITVTHAELTADSFRFSLQVASAWFGRLLLQEAIYQEDKS